MNPILTIARQQFSDIIREPLVVFILLVLLVLSILNGIASADLLRNADISLFDGNDHFLSIGMSNTLYHTSFLLSILSMFIGVFTVAEERANGSIGVLLTKPLYGREMIGGKFIGLSVFLLIATAIIVLLCVSSIMICFGGPVSFEEMALRVFSYIVILSLNCTLMLSISFLIGIFFKGLFEMLLFNGIFLFINWYYTLPPALQGLNFLIPTALYFKIIDGVTRQYVFETNVPYDVWLNAALPYIIFMLFAILAVFLFSCYVFNVKGRD